MRGIKWALDPLVTQFLKACLKIRPLKKPTFPTWNLATVLKALSSPPVHTVDAVSLWDFTLKTTFLIAITSGKRVSEMQALRMKEPHLIFYQVLLRPSDQFIPKV